MALEGNPRGVSSGVQAKELLLVNEHASGGTFHPHHTPVACVYWVGVANCRVPAPGTGRANKRTHARALELSQFYRAIHLDICLVHHHQFTAGRKAALGADCPKPGACRNGHSFACVQLASGRGGR